MPEKKEWEKDTSSGRIGRSISLLYNVLNEIFNCIRYLFSCISTTSKRLQIYISSSSRNGRLIRVHLKQSGRIIWIPYVLRRDNSRPKRRLSAGEPNNGSSRPSPTRTIVYVTMSPTKTVFPSKRPTSMTGESARTVPNYTDGSMGGGANRGTFPDWKAPNDRIWVDIHETRVHSDGVRKESELREGADFVLCPAAKNIPIPVSQNNRSRYPPPR